MKKIFFYLLLVSFFVSMACGKPNPVNNLFGVKLGDTPSIVKSALGNPSLEDADLFAYGNENMEPEIAIHFNQNKKVIGIIVYDSSREANINGIKIGSVLKSVKKTYGKPNSVEYNDEDGYILWYYKKYNLVFEAKNEIISAIGIIDIRQVNLQDL